jgi:hypothetical protein
VPQGADRLRLRAPHGDVSAQGEERRRQLHVEVRQRLWIVLQLLLDVVLRVDEQSQILLEVVRLDETVIGRRADDLQRVFGLR